MTTEATAPAATEQGPIVARAGQYYRVTRYIMTFVLLLYGVWAIHDGFFSWPNWPISHPDEKPKTDTDIIFNKVLGVALPPLAFLLLIRALYLSRGEYRLENGVIHIPGHPPVPLDKIEKVDRELWDRKGIAYAEYDLGSGGKSGRITLDDFVYDRDPVDKIFKAIEESVLKAGARQQSDSAKQPTVPASTLVQPRPVATNPQPKSAIGVSQAKSPTPGRPIAPQKSVSPANPASPVNPASTANPVAPVKAVVPARPATPLQTKPTASPAARPPANPQVKTPPPTRLPPRPKMGP